MQLEKIDVNNIHNYCLAFDDMERSSKTFANKINEIIDVLNEKNKWDFIPNHLELNKNNDWEKEFDVEFPEYTLRIGQQTKIKQFIRNLLK